MKKRNIKIEKETLQNITASLLAILIGLLVGFVVLIVTNPRSSLPAFATILQGGFLHGARGFGNVIFRAVPIILTGLSVGFAFRTGLFNIGVTGQFTVGAFTAVYIGVNKNWGQFTWFYALIFAMLAGMVWALIVGAMKAYRNVNEVIASIMMNYVGMFFVNFLIKQTAYDDVHSRTLPPRNAYLPKAGMDKIFPRSSLNVGIVFAVIAAIVIYIILEKTTFGFELKAVGFNRHAGRYAGINEKRSIMLSMAIAGALAGLGGGLVYLSDVGKYISLSNTLLPEGFDGISVALLAQNHPIAILFSGLFISHITYGGSNLQLYKMEPEIIQVITASIIYVSALSLFLRQFVAKVFKDEKKREVVE